MRSRAAVKILDAHVNERIKVQFEKEVDQTKSFAEKPDDMAVFGRRGADLKLRTP